jgi:predicted nucleic acid-binding protein
MEMGDVLIAATALAQEELLCTSNSKHFGQVNGLIIGHYLPGK